MSNWSRHKSASPARCCCWRSSWPPCWRLSWRRSRRTSSSRTASPTMAGRCRPAAFLLGTDLLGRDLLSRLIYGARTSLIIGVVANGVAVVTGDAPRRRRRLSARAGRRCIMRLTDLMMAFPALLLAIALAAIFEPSLWIVAMVIAMVNWVQIARVIYTETTALAEREFVLATVGFGAGPGASSAATSCRICCRRSWSGRRSASRPPCCWRRPSPSSASGCGRPRRPGATSSTRTRPISPRRPGWCSARRSAIIVLALSFNLVGDALRDVLDPRQRERRLMPGYLALAPAAIGRRSCSGSRSVTFALPVPGAGRSGAADRRAAAPRREAVNRSVTRSASTGRSPCSSPATSAVSRTATSAAPMSSGPM